MQCLPVEERFHLGQFKKNLTKAFTITSTASEIWGPHDWWCEMSKASWNPLFNHLVSWPEYMHQRGTVLPLNFVFVNVFYSDGILSFIPFLTHKSFSFYQFLPSLTCVSVSLSHFVSSTLALTHTLPFHFSPTLPTHTHKLPLFGCLCSTGSKSLAAPCSSPNLPSLCTIALGTKLKPHNSRPARVNSRANTVKAKTHFLLSPTSPAKN